MSPESPQATSRRASYGGNRSSGSPRHSNKNKGQRGQYTRPNRSSPKSLFQQQHHLPASPSRSPKHTSSVIGMVSRDDSSNNNGSSTTLGFINLSGSCSFAGSKFNEAPPPDLLPKPPAHWLASGLSVGASSINQSLTLHLKSVLNVPIHS